MSIEDKNFIGWQGKKKGSEYLGTNGRLWYKMKMAGTNFRLLIQWSVLAKFSRMKHYPCFVDYLVDNF